MRNYIQLVTGMVIEFDINESPMKYDEKGFSIIHTGTALISNRWMKVQHFKYNIKDVVADWNSNE